jgi:hypothetical protein
MRRALIALVAAVLIVGATAVVFLSFEPSLGPRSAFWPGFLAQSALERIGTCHNRSKWYLHTSLN